VLSTAMGLLPPDAPAPPESVESLTDQDETATIPLKEHLQTVLSQARAITTLQEQLDSAIKAQPSPDDTSPVPSSADHSECVSLRHHQSLVADFDRQLGSVHDDCVSIASHEAALAPLQNHIRQLQVEAAEALAAPPHNEPPYSIPSGLRLDDQSVYIASLQQIVQEQRVRLDREAADNSDSLRDAERKHRLLKHQCAELADDLELHQKRHQTTLSRTTAESLASQRDFDDQLAALQSQIEALLQHYQKQPPAEGVRRRGYWSRGYLCTAPITPPLLQ
jgi:hypothetical protein